jgi:hypothetical protein
VTFPAAIVVLLIVGVALIFVGRDRRVSAATDQPRVNLDHWHAAYGIYICGSFQPDLTDRRGDARGIHTHGDGVIHIHPYTSAAAGKKATLDDFFYEEKLTVTNDKLELPGGETWENGKTCPDSGKAGRVVLAEWKNADDSEAAPKIITKDIADVRFTNDRMAFTLAFVPEDQFGSIPRPPSIPTLDNLSDVPGGGAPASVPGSTAPGGTTGDTVNPGESPSSTAPGATPAPGESSSTTAPAATTAPGATSPPSSAAGNG